MTDTSNRPYDEADEDVQGHTSSPVFRRPANVSETDEDEDDVEGHGWHAHHHKH